MNYIFASNVTKNAQSTVGAVLEETIKAVFIPFLEKLKLYFSLSSFNVDFNTNELQLGFNGNYQDFID